MKELILSVLIFFIIERMAILVSAYSVKSSQDMIVSRKRAQIELAFLTCSMVVFWYTLKG